MIEFWTRVGILLISIPFILESISYITRYQTSKPQTGKYKYFICRINDKGACIWKYYQVQVILADSMEEAEEKALQMGFRTFNSGGAYVLMDQIDYQIYFQTK